MRTTGGDGEQGSVIDSSRVKEGYVRHHAGPWSPSLRPKVFIRRTPLASSLSPRGLPLGLPCVGK